MVIEWSQRALDDLKDLNDYISKDSRFYAQRFVERIIDAVEQLSNFPTMGRQVPEAADRDDIRELIYQGYRIIYRTQPNRVDIVTIVHGSRDLATKEDRPWGDT